MLPIPEKASTLMRSSEHMFFSGPTCLYVKLRLWHGCVRWQPLPRNAHIAALVRLLLDPRLHPEVEDLNTHRHLTSNVLLGHKSGGHPRRSSIAEALPLSDSFIVPS